MSHVEDSTVSACLFTALGGIGIELLGHNYRNRIENSTFEYLFASAVALYGQTKLNLNENGMQNPPPSHHSNGPDGCDLDVPLNTLIEGNLAHDLGLWQKQSSFLFQAISARTTTRHNAVYNLPRAAINLNDDFGGNDLIEGNLLVNAVRESGDHGPINSWSRLPYITTIRNGSASIVPAPRTITRNAIRSTYSSQECIDNDDGSAFYNASHNVLAYALATEDVLFFWMSWALVLVPLLPEDCLRITTVSTMVHFVGHWLVWWLRLSVNSLFAASYFMILFDSTFLHPNLGRWSVAEQDKIFSELDNVYTQVKAIEHINDVATLTQQFDAQRFNYDNEKPEEDFSFAKHGKAVREQYRADIINDAVAAINASRAHLRAHLFKLGPPNHHATKNTTQLTCNWLQRKVGLSLQRQAKKRPQQPSQSTVQDHSDDHDEMTLICHKQVKRKIEKLRYALSWTNRRGVSETTPVTLVSNLSKSWEWVFLTISALSLILGQLQKMASHVTKAKKSFNIAAKRQALGEGTERDLNMLNFSINFPIPAQDTDTDAAEDSSDTLRHTVSFPGETQAVERADSTVPGSYRVETAHSGVKITQRKLRYNTVFERDLDDMLQGNTRAGGDAVKKLFRKLTGKLTLKGHPLVGRNWDVGDVVEMRWEDFVQKRWVAFEEDMQKKTANHWKEYLSTEADYVPMQLWRSNARASMDDLYRGDRADPSPFSPQMTDDEPVETIDYERFSFYGRAQQMDKFDCNLRRVPTEDPPKVKEQESEPLYFGLKLEKKKPVDEQDDQQLSRRELVGLLASVNMTLTEKSSATYFDMLAGVKSKWKVYYFAIVFKDVEDKQYEKLRVLLVEKSLLDSDIMFQVDGGDEIENPKAKHGGQRWETLREMARLQRAGESIRQGRIWEVDIWVPEAYMQAPEPELQRTDSECTVRLASAPLGDDDADDGDDDEDEDGTFNRGNEPVDGLSSQDLTVAQSSAVDSPPPSPDEPSPDDRRKTKKSSSKEISFAADFMVKTTSGTTSRVDSDKARQKAEGADKIHPCSPQKGSGSGRSLGVHAHAVTLLTIVGLATAEGTSAAAAAPWFAVSRQLSWAELVQLQIEGTVGMQLIVLWLIVWAQYSGGRSHTSKTLTDDEEKEREFLLISAAVVVTITASPYVFYAGSLDEFWPAALVVICIVFGQCGVIYSLYTLARRKEGRSAARWVRSSADGVAAATSAAAAFLFTANLVWYSEKHNSVTCASPSFPQSDLRSTWLIGVTLLLSLSASIGYYTGLLVAKDRWKHADPVIMINGATGLDAGEVNGTYEVDKEIATKILREAAKSKSIAVNSVADSTTIASLHPPIYRRTLDANGRNVDYAKSRWLYVTKPKDGSPKCWMGGSEESMKDGNRDGKFRSDAIANGALPTDNELQWHSLCDSVVLTRAAANGHDRSLTTVFAVDVVTEAEKWIKRTNVNKIVLKIIAPGIGPVLHWFGWLWLYLPLCILYRIAQITEKYMWSNLKEQRITFGRNTFYSYLFILCVAGFVQGSWAGSFSWTDDVLLLACALLIIIVENKMLPQFVLIDIAIAMLCISAALLIMPSLMHEDLGGHGNALGSSFGPVWDVQSQDLIYKQVNDVQEQLERMKQLSSRQELLTEAQFARFSGESQFNGTEYRRKGLAICAKHIVRYQTKLLEIGAISSIGTCEWELEQIDGKPSECFEQIELLMEALEVAVSWSVRRGVDNSMLELIIGFFTRYGSVFVSVQGFLFTVGRLRKTLASFRTSKSESRHSAPRLNFSLNYFLPDESAQYIERTPSGVCTLPDVEQLPEKRQLQFRTLMERDLDKLLNGNISIVRKLQKATHLTKPAHPFVCTDLDKASEASMKALREKHPEAQEPQWQFCMKRPEQEEVHWTAFDGHFAQTLVARGWRKFLALSSLKKVKPTLLPAIQFPEKEESPGTRHTSARFFLGDDSSKRNLTMSGSDVKFRLSKTSSAKSNSSRSSRASDRESFGSRSYKAKLFASQGKVNFLNMTVTFGSDGPFPIKRVDLAVHDALAKNQSATPKASRMSEMWKQAQQMAHDLMPSEEKAEGLTQGDLSALRMQVLNEISSKYSSGYLDMTIGLKSKFKSYYFGLTYETCPCSLPEDDAAYLTPAECDACGDHIPRHKLRVMLIEKSVLDHNSIFLEPSFEMKRFRPRWECLKEMARLARAGEAGARPGAGNRLDSVQIWRASPEKLSAFFDGLDSDSDSDLESAMQRVQTLPVQAHRVAATAAAVASEQTPHSQESTRVSAGDLSLSSPLGRTSSSPAPDGQEDGGALRSTFSGADLFLREDETSPTARFDPVQEGEQMLDSAGRVRQRSLSESFDSDRSADRDTSDLGNSTSFLEAGAISGGRYVEGEEEEEAHTPIASSPQRPRRVTSAELGRTSSRTSSHGGSSRVLGEDDTPVSPRFGNFARTETSTSDGGVAVTNSTNSNRTASS